MNDIIISEAKEMLAEINNGISKTRNRCWQFMGLIIAIDIYLLKSSLEETASFQLKILGLIAMPFSLYCLFKLLYSAIPSTLSISGTHPKEIQKISNGDKKFLEKNLIYGLELRIDCMSSNRTELFQSKNKRVLVLI